ncbi:hypothetical protein FRC19_008959 [Serendipita sp. 401]|nr:hypothetical protein FRC19_008959 [Serendipita sp. 401]
MQRKSSIAFIARFGKIKSVLRITDSTPKFRKPSRKPTISIDLVDALDVPAAEVERPKPLRRKGIVPKSQKSSTPENREPYVPQPRRKSTIKSVVSNTERGARKETAQNGISTSKKSKSKEVPLKESGLVNAQASAVDAVVTEQPLQRCTRGSNRGKHADPPSYHSKRTQSPVAIRRQHPKDATASASTTPLPSNPQNQPIIPASIAQNLYQPIDWDSERRKLDRHHRSWLDHYAGNTTEANHEVLRRIVHHIQTYGTPPMEVFVKVNSKSGVGKVTCGVCRANYLKRLISSDEIREFPTIQKAASHITSEHWQLQLWTCPNGCGKSFQYRDGIKDQKKHAGGCQVSPTSTSPPQYSPTGAVFGTESLSVSTNHGDHYTSNALPGGSSRHGSKTVESQNHQASHMNPAVLPERRNGNHGKGGLSDMVPLLIGYPHPSSPTVVGKGIGQPLMQTVGHPPTSHSGYSSSQAGFNQASISGIGVVPAPQLRSSHLVQPVYTSTTNSVQPTSSHFDESGDWRQAVSNSQAATYQHQHSAASTSQTRRNYIQQQPPVVPSGSGSSSSHSNMGYSHHGSRMAQQQQQPLPSQYPIATGLTQDYPAQPAHTTIYHTSSLTTTQDPCTSVYGLAAGWEGSSHALASHQQHGFNSTYSTTSGMGNGSGYLPYSGEAIPRSNGSQLGYSGAAAPVPQSRSLGTSGRHSIASSVLPTVNVSFMRPVQRNSHHFIPQ